LPYLEGENNQQSEGTMKNYRELKVWEKAHALNLCVYGETKRFPSDEKHRLTDQIRRAAISIPSNIAEGCGRNSDPELVRFFTTAKGSASELDYQLMLSRDLGYLQDEAYQTLRESLEEIQKMLAAFIIKVRMKA
jgi:four helix bundle protein